MAAGLSRWAWELATRAAWEYLEGQLLHTEPAFLPLLATNATSAATVPAILLGAGPSAETFQTVGTVDVVLLCPGSMAEDTHQALRLPLAPESRRP